MQIPIAVEKQRLTGLKTHFLPQTGFHAPCPRRSKGWAKGVANLSISKKFFARLHPIRAKIMLQYYYYLVGFALFLSLCLCFILL